MKELYKRTANTITSNAIEWKKFLKLTGALHRYSYIDKLMIFDQNPAVTQVATAQEWNKIGRLIKPDGEGITLFEDQSDLFKLKQVYDIEHTYGDDKNLPDWSATEDVALKTIQKMYAQTFDTDIAVNSMSTALIELIDHGVFHYAQQEQTTIVKDHLELIEESISYAMGQKATWLKQFTDDDLLEKISTVRPGIELNTIGFVTNKVTESLLNHLHAIKLELSLKEEKQNDKQKYSVLEQQEVRSTTSGLRKDSQRIPKRETTSSVHNLSDGGNVDGVSSQNRGSVNRSRDTAGETNTKPTPISKNRKSISERSTLESNSKSSERASDSGNAEDDRQQLNKKQEKVDDDKNLPSLLDYATGDDKSDRIYVNKIEKQEYFLSVLTKGTNIENGKFRIFDMYQREMSTKERISFLKKEYGVGGYAESNQPHVSFDSKGIAINFPDKKELYSWEIIESSLQQLIYEDEYLSADEKKDFSVYLEELPVSLKDLKEIVKAGPLKINGKETIADYFLEESNLEKRAEMISKLYGTGGFLSSKTRCTVEFNLDSMSIQPKGRPSPYFVPWSVIAKQIELLIQDGSYLNKRKFIQENRQEISLFDIYDSNVTQDEWKNSLVHKLKSKPFSIEYLHLILEDLSLTLPLKELGTENHDEVIEFLVQEKFATSTNTDAKVNFSQEGLTIKITRVDDTHFFNWDKIAKEMVYILPFKETDLIQQIEKEGKGEDIESSLFDFSYETDNGTGSEKEHSNPISNYYNQELIQYKDKKREKCRENIQAISTLKKIEQGEIQLTKESQKILAKYSGWGGIQEVFDERNKSWADEYNQLKSVLTTEEYEQARKSVLTAFYTPPEIIHEMYHVLESIGDYSGKSILDAGMGTGNFFMNLPDTLKTTKKIGVELDSITGRIATCLFPEAEIHKKGYEKVELAEKIDVVIGNIPFNDIRVQDKKYDKYNFAIHDYFLAKSIDLLKENGILMVITSSSSMDKRNSKARDYLAKRAKFIGGVRLPKTAFKQSAGTEVISDILIFQKKSYKEMMQEYEAPYWVNAIDHPEYQGLWMNNYFVQNSDHILGQISIKNFHGQTLDVLPSETQTLQEQMRTVFDKLVSHKSFEQTKINPVLVKREKSVVDKPKEPKGIVIPEDARKFTFLDIDSVIVYHHSNGKYDQIPSGNKRNKIRLMLEVKKTLNDVIRLQQRSYTTTELEKSLRELNRTYDTFTAKYGYFNEKRNIRDLRMDDQYPLLRSIEKEEKNSFVKQEIFFKATIKPQETITQVDSASKALDLSLAKYAAVNFEFMSEVYPGRSIDQMIKELDTQIYLNPRKIEKNGYENSWEYSDEYLTGNVKEKLTIATLAEKRETDPTRKMHYQNNVKALETAQPKPLQAGDIDFQLGSPWIPTKYYNQFLYELLEIPEKRQGTSFGHIFVDYLDHNSTWKIVGYSRNTGDIRATKTYGTARKNAYEIIEAALNLQKVKVNDKVRDPNTGNIKYELNPEQTMLAREKQEDIEDVFHQWLFSDAERRSKLVTIYNERFNTITPRKYSGENLVFDDMNLQMALRPHQKNVVARILYSGKALMAHEVGAGKTAAMLSAGMYLKKNGLINKPLYVVPNHLTEQWGREILTFYPSANILITTKRDFEKENRNQFVSKIATGDYDAIIIGHSQFERIPLSKERQEKMLREQLTEVTQIVKELKEKDNKNWTVKQMEKFRDNLKTSLKKLANEEKKDNLLTFEQLGVDFLFVDEAHVYKNLFTFTKMNNVAGVGKSNSQRATDMFNKVRYIQEKHDGKNVVFATGTPISNSMSEMYVMQLFLQPEELLRRGLTSFDAWAATFGQVVSSLEITPEASGYRLRDRFKKFHNLPELMNMFNLVADIQTSDMLKLPVPKLKTGKVQTILAEKSPFQERMMEEFVARSEAIRSGSVNPSEDNMLKLTHEAKLMAIDSRLIDPSQPRDPDSKISLCCEKVHSIWERTKENRSTQMIFSDAGTPKKDVFNVYDEVKNQLVEKGVPANEIAFIHDAKTDVQKDTLFEKVRSGEIRVLLGSTQKVGTGTNVQNKLIAAHHIDCPWKPSDLTQREGRILRQGNENEEVAIYRYITKGTFDSYLWQIQEQKLTYISQVMTGKSISRSCEDLDETVLSAGEVKAIATENPMLAEKMTLDNEVSRLQLLRSEWENQRSRLDTDVRITYPNKLAKLNEDLKKYKMDNERLQKNPLSEFKMTIGSTEYTERQKAFDELYSKYQLTETNSYGKAVICGGTYRGFEVEIERNDYGQDQLVLKGEQTYRTNFTLDTGIGNITRLTNLPDRVQELVRMTHEEIEDTKKQIVNAEVEANKPFTKQDELNQKLKRQRELTKQIELDTLKMTPQKNTQLQKSL